ELQKEDPSAINNLVDKHILPYSDFPRMTRMAVGPQWRNATPEQKEEIQTLFRKLLIAVYSGALKEASDYSMQLGRNNINPNEKVVLVRTKLTASQREPIQLDYRLLKTKDNEWKVFDVNVGGVWLVENYRSQFASVISNGGLNGLITELRKKANK
ncbi:MlaC/ttg2D family ABC transporter substrate-binding protein, partial [Turicimonas muris]